MSWLLKIKSRFEREFNAALKREAEKRAKEFLDKVIASERFDYGKIPKPQQTWCSTDNYDLKLSTKA